MKIPLFIWQFDTDYHDGIPTDDSALPMGGALVKINDGTNFMGAFDTSPVAARSLADVTRLKNAYAVPMMPWGVAHGNDTNLAGTEGILAGRIALTAQRPYTLDLEPYEGFWKGGDAEVDAFVASYSIGSSGAELWLAPDTRASANAGTHLTRWLTHHEVTRVMPQAYWTDFQMSGLAAFAATLSPLNDIGLTAQSGRVYPVLPGDATPSDMLNAIEMLEDWGYPGFSIWRRGTMTQALIDALNNRAPYKPNVPLTVDPRIIVARNLLNGAQDLLNDVIGQGS